MKALRSIANFMSLAGGVALFVMSFVISADVLLRQFFSRPIGGIDELSGFVLAIVFTWGLAHTFLTRTHIRVDVFYWLMPKQTRTWIDIVAMLSLLFIACFLSWHASQVFWLSVQFNSHSASHLSIPMWIVQGLWLVGLLFFAAVIAIVSFVVFGKVLRMDTAAIDGLIAPTSAEEEVEEEIGRLRKSGTASDAGKGRGLRLSFSSSSSRCCCCRCTWRPRWGFRR